ncbi:MAG TPA: sulfatase-like hydrolase/transferase [Pirellulales bacterium]|jgi:arylsulfatase A-like enzyme|nr:sulfatase-like hydrolase/transferase [Pirellulales bacterium]
MTRCLALLVGLSGVLCNAVVAAEGSAKPNILILYADDLGYHELSCYGGKHVPTPNIDSIAAGGVRCTQGYVSAPLCSPSRAGLMTGRYQTRFSHESNNMAPEGGLPLKETTLADRMKKLGYATGMVGKWHLGSRDDYLPMKRGFDDYYGVLGNPGSYFTPHGFMDSRVSSSSIQVDDPNFYTTDAFAVRAVEWIEQHKDNPWFLYLPFNAIHSPFQATEKYRDRFKDVEDKHVRELFAMTSAMDDAVGKVLAKVRDLGQENNTLIFFISDNGAPPSHPDGNDPLRGNKHTCWEGGFKVPFMVQWKGKLPAGKVIDTPVVQLDVMPTCVAAAGGAVKPAWKLDGVDLMPYLAGENKGRPHEDFFWRIDGMWAIRHADWKLVLGKPDATVELFNLATDPNEEHDLASSEPSKVAELQKLWDAWNAEQASSTPKREKAAKKERNKKRAGERTKRETKKAA